MSGPDVDIVITEVGGTVGDIESLPFLEAARQVRHEVGRDNVFLPARVSGALHRPEWRAEDKAGRSTRSLRCARSVSSRTPWCAEPTGPIPQNVKRKISLMCDVDEEAVIAAVDAPSIYDIPKVLHAEGLDAYVVRRLGLPVPRCRLDSVGRSLASSAPPCTRG